MDGRYLLTDIDSQEVLSTGTAWVMFPHLHVQVSSASHTHVRCGSREQTHRFLITAKRMVGKKMEAWYTLQSHCEKYRAQILHARPSAEDGHYYCGGSIEPLRDLILLKPIIAEFDGPVFEGKKSSQKGSITWNVRKRFNLISIIAANKQAVNVIFGY
ncbi:hypothetical protein SBOR_1007 [Sclerotinia borealis F-4128]|uniref:Uncharacterized protein n=1 Tax=Sclerotinia borealis (strain F-4128) TaxID=1432307 RepID=W9CP12_SCLBF|nr:hypothetical protein SBOR_1007 [Sclerotinia borealis F-4128]